jgi:hypothetical protein
MTTRIPIFFALITLLLTLHPAHACCPVSRADRPVVNGDQNVIMVWDAKTKTQHFIRQASFKTQNKDLGFIVPTPTQPELSESGDEAFALLEKITAPPVVEQSEPISFPIACSQRDSAVKSAAEARVLEEKRIAGFDIAVLEADNAAALKTWLADHGYPFSPQVEAWAAPYIADKWKFTAMKVARENPSDSSSSMSASALRLTFKTDRPLFPYREPDSQDAAKQVHAYQRLLKIYFIADARYQGELTPTKRWTGQVTWANRLAPQDVASVTAALKLPAGSTPASPWLTTFEDDWPYQVAPADLYFSPELTQKIVEPAPIIKYVARSIDPTLLAVGGLFVGVLVIVPLIRARRSKQQANASSASNP